MKVFLKNPHPNLSGAFKVSYLDRVAQGRKPGRAVDNIEGVRGRDDDEVLTVASDGYELIVVRRVGERR